MEIPDLLSFRRQAAAVRVCLTRDRSQRSWRLIVKWLTLHPQSPRAAARGIESLGNGPLSLDASHMPSSETAALLCPGWRIIANNGRVGVVTELECSAAGGILRNTPAVIRGVFR